MNSSLLEGGEWQIHTICFSPVGLGFCSLGRSMDCSFWSDLINSHWTIYVFLSFNLCTLSYVFALCTQLTTHQAGYTLLRVELLCIEFELEKNLQLILYNVTPFFFFLKLQDSSVTPSSESEHVIQVCQRNWLLKSATPFVLVQTAEWQML